MLIRWGRLLEALTLWSMGVRSRTRIARILGMGRADTLSTMARRLTGESWEVVVERGPQETSIEGVFVFQGAKPA